MATIGPQDCAHFNNLFVSAAGGTPLGNDNAIADRYGISVCGDCGQFSVVAEKGGEFINVRFTLGHPRLVKAAGQFMAYLETGDLEPSR